MYDTLDRTGIPAKPRQLYLTADSDNIPFDCFSFRSYFLYSISHPNKHGEPLVDLSAKICRVVY